MLDTANPIETKKPALAGWVPKQKSGFELNPDAGLPVWVRRIQKQGLTPGMLEAYLDNGWPLEAIANDRGLDLCVVIQAMDRWLPARE